jgi:hypothetical protein
MMSAIESTWELKQPNIWDHMEICQSSLKEINLKAQQPQSRKSGDSGTIDFWVLFFVYSIGLYLVIGIISVN